MDHDDHPYHKFLDELGPLPPCPRCGDGDVELLVDTNNLPCQFVWCVSCGFEGPRDIDPFKAADAYRALGPIGRIVNYPHFTDPPWGNMYADRFYHGIHHYHAIEWRYWRQV